MEIVIVIDKMDAKARPTEITIYGDAIPMGLFDGNHTLEKITIASSSKAPQTLFKGITQANKELRAEVEALRAENAELREEMKHLYAVQKVLAYDSEKLALLSGDLKELINKYESR